METNKVQATRHIMHVITILDIYLTRHISANNKVIHIFGNLLCRFLKTNVNVYHVFELKHLLSFHLSHTPTRVSVLSFFRLKNHHEHATDAFIAVFNFFIRVFDIVKQSFKSNNILKFSLLLRKILLR